MFNKKKLSILILSGYILSRLLTSFANFEWNGVFAADREGSGTNKIIAILVDKNTLPNVSGLERYTTHYLPKKYQNTKPLVLTIDTQEYTPFEIQKLLENLYFEGKKDKASALIGLIILGEIPLPVVKYNDFIFPSIYPYVDFLDQKYIRDETSEYFINQKNEGQAEIWHGLINFQNDSSAYGKFFEKLKKYDKDPENFIEKKIRYDDFIALQNNFLEENYKLYTNKMIFGEDIAYHRYTDLLVNTLQAETEKEKADLVKDLPNEGTTTEEFSIPKTKTPTKFLQEKLRALTQDYISTISFPLQRAVSENIKATGRRNGAETHYQKLQLKDDLNLGSKDLQGTFKDINDKLEDFVDKKIKQEKYGMNLVVPTGFKDNKDERKRFLLVNYLIPERKDTFKFFLFGKNTENITGAKENSIFRGTYRNLENFGTYSEIINSKNNPAKTQFESTELKSKSLGASYDVFSQQIQGNRGFNMLNIPKEYDLYEKEKTHAEVKYHCTRRWFGLKRKWVPCSRVERKPVGKCNPNARDKNGEPDYEEMADCEDFEQFGNRIRGGASPLNATGITHNNYSLKDSYNFKSAWKPIFDIAGSVKVKQEEDKAYSFEGIKHYISPTQTSRREGAIKDPNLHAPIKQFDYFNIGLNDKIFLPNGKTFKLIYPKKSATDEQLEYEYKIIDSTLEHKSANADEVNGIERIKHDKNSESYSYYTSFKAINLSTEDQYSTSLIKILGEINKEADKVKGSILEQINAPESIDINGLNTTIKNLATNTATIFSGYLNLINKNYTQEAIANLDSIRYQQVEKNPKIGLLAERYEEIKNNINKLDSFYDKQVKIAPIIFTSYGKILKNTISSIETVENEISKLNQQLNQENISDEEKQKLKEKIKTWETLKTQVEEIKNEITKISQIETCRSLYQELGDILNMKIEENFKTGVNSTECKDTETNGKKAEGGEETEKNRLKREKTNIKNLESDFSSIFYPETKNPKIQIPGMNQTTPDRPIDSPRYTTFQGVGGNVVKLIYPNIFKVETFNLSGDALSLKKNTVKEQEFKEAIETYLKNKVNEYNTILNQEKGKALKNSPHFFKLKAIDPLATPTLESNIRPYKPFTYEEMLNAIGGEKMLNTLAQLLYYQNVAIKNRGISDDILQDISNTKKAFNLNKKISYLTKNYLSQENDKFLKEEFKALPEIVLPNYAGSGYEVGFINSNSNDTITTIENEDLKGYLPHTTLSQDSPEKDESKEAAGDNQTEKECGFNYNEAVLLVDLPSFKSPWLEGFQCWLEEVKKKPFELKLVREQGSLTEPMGIVEDHNYPNGFTTSTTKYQGLPADKTLGTVFEDIQITNKKQRISVEDQNPNAFSFQSLRPEAENISVSFKSTGENCLLIGNTNTCETAVKKTLKISNPGFSVPFTLAKKKASSFHTTLEICQGNGQRCGRKTYNLTATPGQIDHFDIKLGENNTFAAGVYALIDLKAFDQFKNEISKSLDSYTLKASKGGFIIGGEPQAAIEISDFKNTTIIYRAGAKDIGTVYFTIHKSKDAEKKILGKNSGTILPANFEVHHKGKKITNLKYQLEDLPIKIKQENKEAINENKAYKLEILLKDNAGKPLPVTTRAQLQTKNNLIQTYILDDKNSLKAASAITLKNGKAEFYLMSQNIAGLEELNVIIPGLKPETIKINILPGEAEILALKMSEYFVPINTQVKGIVSLTDKWGNRVNKDYIAGYTLIRPEGSITKRIVIPQGQKEIAYTMKELDTSAIFQIKVNGAKIPLQTQQIVKLKENFLDAAVQSGLNIMYLNYFGSDWGNQRGYLSDKSAYGEEIIKKSDKTLAITTQLVDLKKIGKPTILLTKEKIENLGKVDIQANFLNQQNIELKIPNIGKVKILDPLLESVTLNNSDLILQSIKKRQKASIIVYDISPEFVYKNKQLYLDSNPEKALASWGNGLSLKITDEEKNQLPVWDILWNNKAIGKAILTKVNFSKSRAELENKNYTLENTFYKGSTYNTAKGIFNQLSLLKDEYQGYDSIQNSDEMDKFIGFRGNFKNISSFAAGMSVGEATIPFGSEFLINLGDPALTRKSTNTDLPNADHNGGLGKIVYSDSQQNIFKVIDIDYNKDGLQDLIIVYSNGTIKLQKQYADQRFSDLEDLMISVEQIEEIFVGDVDGNSYQDIIIKNKKGQIRAYLNNRGEFDVDGKIACLNTNAPEGKISSNPETQSLHQLFIQDMDRDGITDIITYDLIGDIKIFYGAGGRENHSYLSKEAYKCDPDRSKRQTPSSQKVRNLGTNITPASIKDESLVRRAGLKNPSVNEIKNETANKVNDNFPSTLNPSNNHLNALNNNFNSLELANTAINTSERYVLNPFDQNIIKDGLLKKEQAYIPINKLDKNIDPIEVTKTFRDINGAPLLPDDKVQVSITIKANKKIENAAFFDRLQGPRKIKLDNFNRPENFKFLKGEATFHPQINNTIYYLTDINLKPGKSLVWNYTISFHAQAGNSAFKINIEDIDILDYQYLPKIKKTVRKDGLDMENLPDIEILPNSGCEKEKEVLFNRRGGKRTYQAKRINLQELVDAHNEDVENAKKKAKSESENKIQNVQKGGLESIPGFSKIGESIPTRSYLKNLREEGFKSGTFDFGEVLNLEDIIGKDLDNVEKEISDLAAKACKGFSLGSKKKSCKGLPVPFNQAFLAPGNYHIMGCIPLEPLTQTLGKGLPVFHFPGTLTTPIGPIPFPRGLKSPADEFLWVGGGQYPSMIRIYAAPTLTAQLGIAICLGPQKIGTKIPSPLADLGGNCIVTSVALPCGDGEEEKKYDGPEELEKRTKGYKELGSCESNNQSSPFSSNQNTNTPVTFERDNMSFENKVIIPASQEISIPNIIIGGVNNSNNKILGGNEKGIKKIVGDFLYNQIEYIKNNLLRWHLNLYLPDFSKIHEDIQELKILSKDKGTSKIEFEKVGLKNPFTNPTHKEQITKLGITEETNPFLQVKKLFNQSELINISTQNIPVHIPRIYAEDIEAYANYLKTWGETQKATIETRKSEIQAIIGSCPTQIAKLKNQGKLKELEQKLQECQTAEKISAELLKLTGKFDKVSKQILENIQTLEAYKRFPLEVYEWLHVVDKYMAEIAGVMDNFYGYLNFWMDLNASRFSQYVDAIITILAVVKTYQILIDVTANRSSKCGTCTNDTYDQYTCKLSFLCNGINIDPLPIPNVKIPSLNIDLSNIDSSLDIILPNFEFIPKSIELPRLQNLPLPPAVGLKVDRDFNIPDIPKIPEPPTLPELPSLLPQVKLKLPILPPAPKIPELPNSISGTLKIIEKIGKIYCIIKQGFGLVGESSVKAKIEQMTQRTYDVPWVDHLDLLSNFQARLWKTNLKGVDYGIESHVNLQYNFDQFYVFLKGTADAVNNYTDIATNFASNASNKATALGQKSENFIQEKIDEGGQYLNVDVKISPDNLSTYLKPTTIEKKTTKPELRKQLEYAISKLQSPTDQEKFKTVLSLTQKSTKIEKDQNKLNKMKNQISKVISDRKKETLELATLAKKDYKEFLIALAPHNRQQKKLQLTFNANLLKDNSEIESVLAKNNLEDLYINTQEKQIDGYLKALRSHSPDQLNMSPEIHQKNTNYLKNIKKEIKKYYLVKSSKKSGIPTLLTRNGNSVQKQLYAKADIETPDYIGEIQKAEKQAPAPINQSPDFSHYVKGVLLNTKDKASLINVVNSEYNYEKYQNYYEKDMNNDGKKDLVLWDQNTVYIKYANDFIPSKGSSGKFYQINLSLKNKKQKYEKTQGTAFKVYDEAPEVKNFTLKGQTFDALSFSWDHNHNSPLSGYLMRIADRIHNHPEKRETDLDKYVLFLPKDTSLTGVDLQIQAQKTAITTLLKNKTLYTVKYYDPEKEKLDFGISEVPRKWQYLQITSLERKGNLYIKNAPRSNQELGGRQITADTEAPVPTISLLRPKKNYQIEDQGNQLEGRVGTYYDLHIAWEDNVQVDEAKLKQGEKTLISTVIGKQKGEIRVPNLFFTKQQDLNYTIEGKDTEGNSVKETITLKIKVPKIKIDNITRLTGRAEGLKKPAMIKSSIEQEIDQGTVTFQRKRNEIIKTITAINKGKPVQHFNVTTDQTELTGQYFDFGNLIGIYSAEKEKYGTVNGENGEIKIDKKFEKNIQISVHFSQGYPVIQINEGEKKRFEIILKAQELIKATAIEGKFLPLKGNQYGAFNGGQALIINGKTMLFVSKTGAIATDTRDLVATYDFNPDTETVTYRIKEHKFGKDIAELEIKTLAL